MDLDLCSLTWRRVEIGRGNDFSNSGLHFNVDADFGDGREELLSST